MKAWFRRPSALLPLVFVNAAFAGVIVADSHGGGQFTNLQMAVNNAQDGDTILVKNGAYSTFTIDGKPLTVAVEDGATATVYGSVVVKNLAAGEVVVLSGLTVTGATTTSMQDAPGTGLIATGNSGALRAMRCRFEGAAAYENTIPDGGDCCALEFHGSGWDGAIVDGNPGGVAFDACVLAGGRAGNADTLCYCGDGTGGGAGLRVAAGLAAVYDCTLVGGHGGGNGSDGGLGGWSCRVLGAGSGITTSGSTFQGGTGGNCYDGVFCEGGPGGDGLRLETGTAAHIVDSAFAGGPGGYAGGFPPGPPGQGIAGPGTPYDFGVPRLTLELGATTVREQAIVPATITGRPGDVVYMLMGRRTPYRAMAMWKGVMLARSELPPHVSAIVGTIPASGVLSTTWIVPSLEASVDASNLFLQVWRNSPIDGRTLGSFAAVTVLDAAF